MAKVITFSRRYPAGHQRAGEPTYFVEKFLNQIRQVYTSNQYYDLILELNPWLEAQDSGRFLASLSPFESAEKGHTVRGSERFKKGERFSPRIWSDRPYNSRQIILARDVLITDVWDFQVNINGEAIRVGKKLIAPELEILARNDGLSLPDFTSWIITPAWIKVQHFAGQIIAWDPKINY